jgi:hypothetical protein
MALFDSGPNFSSIASAAQSLGSGVQSAIGTVGQIAGTASRLAGALNNLSNPSALISQLRGINLPNFSMSGSAFAATRVMFAGPGNKDDWRVRLTIPDNFFASSPVLAPLKNAGGFVFPYTPAITISSSASYEDTPLTHQNFSSISYQNSRIDQFTVNGAFHVEDELQAQYWIAAIHFLRSATKMYTGDDAGGFQGSPPPILALNGYGDYVFKNVPVVVKSFSVDLGADTQFIACTVGANGFSGFGGASGGSAGTIQGLSATANSLAGLAGAFGSAKTAATLGKVASIGSAVTGVASMISGVTQGLSGSFSTSSGATHVPVKSNISVVLQPIYSRQAMRQFSLQQFVNGGYVGGTGGYV